MSFAQDRDELFPLLANDELSELRKIASYYHDKSTLSSSGRGGGKVIPPGKSDKVTTSNENDILEFLLATSSRNCLILSTTNCIQSADNIEKYLHRRNCSRLNYPSANFAILDDIASGKVTLVVVAKGQLENLLKITEGHRVKLVLLTDNSKKLIQKCVSNTWRSFDTVLIRTDEERKLNPEERKKLLDKKVINNGVHLKLEDFASALDEDELFTLSKMEFDEIQFGGQSIPQEQMTSCHFRIPRKFYPITRLQSPDIFLQRPDDIFLVTGCDLELLKSHFKAKNLPIAVASFDRQQTKVEGGQILVATEDQDEAFETIASNLKSNQKVQVHWLHASRDKNGEEFHFDWISTHGQAPPHWEESTDSLGEEDYAQMLGSGADNLWNGICYPERDSMSRTFVFRLGQEIQKFCPNRLVMTMDASTLLKSTQDLVATLNRDRSHLQGGSGDQLHLPHDKFLNEFITNLKIVEKSKHAEASSIIFKTMLQKRTLKGMPNVEILLDGDWEHLSKDDVDTLLKLLQYMRTNWKGIRFGIFFPVALAGENAEVDNLQMRIIHALGDFHVTYGLHRLRFEEQVEIIEKHCEEEHMSPLVAEVAKRCLKILGAAIKDANFGFTSLVEVLLEVVKVSARLVDGEEHHFRECIQDEDNLKQILPPGIILFAQVCESFIKKNLTEWAAENATGPTNAIVETVAAMLHEYHALAKLLPQTRPLLDNNFPEARHFSRDLLKRSGIIADFYEKDNEFYAEFIRPEFQEYLSWTMLQSAGLSTNQEASASVVSSARNLDEETASVDRLLFAGEVERICNEKKLEALKGLSGMEESKWQKETLMSCVGGKRVSLNSFKLVYEWIRGGKRVGGGEVLSEDDAELFAMGMKKGHYSVVMYLLERGHAAGEGEGTKELILKCLQATNEDNPEEIQGKIKILKKIAASKKAEVASVIHGILEEQDWKRTLETKIDYRILEDLERLIGGIFNRMGKNGDNLLHGICSGGFSFGIGGFVKKVVTRGWVDWKDVDGNGRNAVEIALDFGNLGVAEAIADALTQRVHNGEGVEILEKILEVVNSSGDLREIRRIDEKLSYWQPEKIQKVDEMKQKVEVAQGEMKKKQDYKKKKPKWYRPFC